MDDIKKTARDKETDVKEAWRRSDGETLGDDLANARDRATNAVKDVGDEVHKGADEISRDAAYQRGRIDESVDRDEPS